MLLVHLPTEAPIGIFPVKGRKSVLMVTENNSCASFMVLQTTRKIELPLSNSKENSKIHCSVINPSFYMAYMKCKKKS